MSGFPGSRADLGFFFLCLIQCVTLSRAHPGLTSLRLDMLSQSFVHSHLCLTNHCIVPSFNWSCKPLRSVWKSAVGGSQCWADACLWISSRIWLRWPVTGLGAWVYMCISCSDVVINALSTFLFGRTDLISACYRDLPCAEKGVFCCKM